MKQRGQKSSTFGIRTYLEVRSCYESNGYDVEEYAHPDEEDPRGRSILPADMQGPPSLLLSEAQQSRPPANEEDKERETVTQQRDNGSRRRAKRP